MLCRYVIDKEKRLVSTTCWDRVTFAEAKANESQLANDPDFNPDFNHLIDTSGITVLDMSVDELKVMASRGIFSPVSRGAIVATKPAIFGMGRLWEAHHQMANLKDQVGIFYDREAALKWLDLEAHPR